MLFRSDNVFGNHGFNYEASNDYKTSTIRWYLNFDILSKLVSKGANPLPANFPDVGCTDKVWLLSVDEAKRIPRNIRDFREDDWWLRSRGIRTDYAACVGTYGYVNDHGEYVHYNYVAVRPAIIINKNELMK